MRKIKIYCIYLSLLVYALAPALGSAAEGEVDFKKKLGTMLDRVEKSAKIVREQIMQNQSAPFLADLYMQLGDLLAEKSTVLYYLQMETEKRTESKITATQKFSPVVITQQEAIAIYEQILKEFPKFDKRDKVLYRLAVSQKSIDESAAFAKTAEQLIKEYPNTKETVQARLLLGQYYFDSQAFEDALTQLNVVKDSSYPYERNSARYRIGLIDIQKEKPADALKMFEVIALDDELKEEQNPSELSLKTKVAKSNVKREALIDSVRAYTEVFKENADPVSYYAKIAPSETLFQETIEKLSFRYIFLKRYGSAIKLLRTLSERISDPQKVMNIYQQVLVMIPVEERIDVPVVEMAYVLDKYNDWSAHYNLSPTLRKETQIFFEKQIRELGTKSHDLAKTAKDADRKAHLFERARQYYHLYLGQFDKGPKAVKVAINLADVYYNQRNFFQSGSYYLRVFSGEFGLPTAKEELIQNAILSLQKPAEYAFYEQLRNKGMLVKAIQNYMVLNSKKKDDPSLVFAIAKALFEQGYYNRALKDLYTVVKRFPSTHEATDATDLILHYFNMRNDYKGLVSWSEQLMALKLPPSLRTRLTDVHSKAQLHRLNEQVKTQKGYDVMAQGKSYLQTALAIQDSGLRSAALQQALGHSKQERDVDTFLKTATTMAKVEKDPKKRAEILNSMADEVLSITRYYQAVDLFLRLSHDSSLPAATRTTAFDKAVKVTAMLHDPQKLVELLRQPDAHGLPADTRSSAIQQIMGWLESSVQLPEAAQQLLLSQATDEKKLLALFKSQFRLTPITRKALNSKIASECARGTHAAVCKWAMWPEMRAKIDGFAGLMAKTPPQMQAIEPAAARMSGLLDLTKTFEGSGEPQVDILVTMSNADIYDAFGGFLERAASSNKEVEQILRAKAQESQGAARSSRSQCLKIIQAANLESSKYRSLCSAKGHISMAATLENPASFRLQPPGSDPRESDIVDHQKTLFVKRDEWKTYFNLGESYLNHKEWYHASATAMMARSTFPQSEEEFNAIFGCALAGMGLASEALFVLTKASDLNGHKTECVSRAKSAGTQ